MKRGDTSLLPPDGVCEYCGTDEPGGRAAFQRWSRVQVRINDECNIIRSFVCCRSCYVPTLPSHKATAQINCNGDLSIVKPNGKELSRSPKKSTRHSVGYKRDTIYFGPLERNAVMKHYWQHQAHTKRKVVEVLPPDDPVVFSTEHGLEEI